MENVEGEMILDLQNSFADRLCPFDQHRRHLVVVVHQFLQLLFGADRISLVRIGTSCGSCGGSSSQPFDVRNAIGEAMLWSSIGHNATQKASRAAPRKDPWVGEDN